MKKVLIRHRTPIGIASLLVVIVPLLFLALPRAHAAWQLDPTFGTNGIVTTAFANSATIHSAALQQDGRIVVGGSISNANYQSWIVGRYNANGSIDTTFGNQGTVIHDFGQDNMITGVGIQSTGAIVVAGTGGQSTTWTVGRYNPDGTIDTTFGTNGIASINVPLNGAFLDIQGLTIQPDDTILTVGYNGAGSLNGSDFTVVRQNADGSLDTTFGNNGIAQVRYDGSINDNAHAIAIQPDGKILVCGDYAYGGPGQPLLERFNPDGSLDTTFGNGGFVTESVGYFSGSSTVTVQPDGKILVAGGDWAVSFPNPPLETYLIRYNSDGTRDASFGVNGLVLNPFNSGFDSPSSLAVDSLGRIVLGGSLGTQQQGNFLVARFYADGSLDNTFGNGGSIVTSIGTGSSGISKILLPGGSILGVGGVCGTSCEWALAQYVSPPPPPTPTPTIASCPAASSIAANFNGTAIAGGNYLWFSSVLKVQGLGSSVATIRFHNQTIGFTANGGTYTLNVPDAAVTFDPSATAATTSFDTGSQTWITTVPSSLSGNTFLSGLAFPVPPAGLPGGIKNVAWSGTVELPLGQSLTVNWQWAAAVYTQFSTTYANLGVKPVDNPTLSQYQNSDHAGTPENFKTYVTGGATGGGGSNYTGGLSATKSATCS